MIYTQNQQNTYVFTCRGLVLKWHFVEEEQSFVLRFAGTHSKAIVYLLQVKNFLAKISVVDASGGS